MENKTGDKTQPILTYCWRSTKKALTRRQLQLRSSRVVTQSFNPVLYPTQITFAAGINNDLITVSHAGKPGMIPDEEMHIFHNFICCITLLIDFHTPPILDDRVQLIHIP